MKSITVVAVTDTFRVEEHISAVRHTARCLPSYLEVEKLLISSRIPVGMDGFCWAAAPFSVTNRQKGEYSAFILSGLADVIATDFALVVQHDGFALNPSAWTDEFLKYDYIGAPFADQPILKHIFPRFKNRVGNGGFSLRSKRWLELGKTAPRHTDEAEDMFCTQKHVHHWTSNGCRVAPLGLAARFSVETPVPSCPQWTPATAFGFHGFDNGDFRFYNPPTQWETYKRFARRKLEQIGILK